MVTDIGEDSVCREKLVLFNSFAELGKRSRSRQSLIPATADGVKPIYFVHYKTEKSESVVIEFPTYQLTLVRYKHSNDIVSRVEIRKDLARQLDTPYQSMPLEKLKVIQKTISDFSTLMLIRYWVKSLIT